jgi:hypothetical protein
MKWLKSTPATATRNNKMPIPATARIMYVPKILRFFVFFSVFFGRRRVRFAILNS